MLHDNRIYYHTKNKMLTFDKDFLFSNGFSAASGLAPTPYPKEGYNCTYDWFDGMFDDDEQIDPTTGKNYVKEELEKAVFDGKLHGITVTWYDNSWGYGNGTDTDVKFSFSKTFDDDFVTFKELLVAIHEGFSKKGRRM